MEINSVTDLAMDGTIAVITIDSPPVNALSPDVRKGLMQAFTKAIADPEVEAIVLACAGRTFIAGADIKEFENKVFAEPDLLQVQAVIEASPKPTVAAIHGTALGGGLEVTLCCHFRVAVPSAKLGLPEVALGLLPGAGGTQRLPRIIGAQAALDMMVSGRPVSAKDAQAMGLVDAVVAEDYLLRDALAFARNVVDEEQALVRVRDRAEGLQKELPDGFFEDFRKSRPRQFTGFKAPENIVKAVEAAVSLPFDEGMRREGELFTELFNSTESSAQRYQFFAERDVAKVPGIARSTQQREVTQIGVIGAGTMGGGIAMAFLDRGFPVTMVEQKQEALDRGLKTISRNYQATVDKGRMTQAQLDDRMARLTPTLELADLSEVDLVVEAVFENMDIKRSIFGELDSIAKPGAILASNTSFLDLNQIAAATSRPESVVGMHFFSPANVMRLLEVVRGSATSDEVIATAMEIGRKLGKVAVLSGVCDGFIANRAMVTRMDAAHALLLDGPMPWDVDRVMLAYGFPMGPFAMLDLVGLDVIGWDADKSSSSTVVEVLCEAGRWGQKRASGFYDYDEKRRATPSPFAEETIRAFQAKSGNMPRTFTDAEIVERLLFPVINEGARILDEGIALRASDVDVALVQGYGWPVYTGGPLFWADTIGLPRVVAGLEASGQMPSPLLRQLADEGAPIHRYQAKAQGA